MKVWAGGRSLPPLILLLCHMCLAHPAASGSEAVPDEEMEDPDGRMETVQVTATRRARSVYDVSEAVTVIRAAEVAARAPQVVAEVLRDEPGAFFQSTTPGQGVPIVRGLKGSQVLHLVDGMRLNNAFFRDAPNQYVGLVDPHNTDRVELVRGAAPSLYGADAMGGVMQILSPEPRFEGPGWQNSGRLYGSFNSADDSAAMRAEAAAGRSGRSLSGGISFRSHDDRRVGGGEVAAPSGYRVRAGDFKWLQEAGENGEVMLSVQALEQPSTPRVDELVPGYGQDHPSSRQFEFQPNRRSFVHARYRLDGEFAWFTDMTVDIARQVIVDDRLTQEFASPERVDEANRSTLDGVTVQVLTPLPQTKQSLDLSWGGEYYSDSVDSSRSVTDTDTGITGAARGRFPDGSTMDNAAAYALLTWHGESLEVRGGLRYSNFRIVLPPGEELERVVLSPDDLTGDIHFDWRLTPSVHIVSNIGRGFRPPNVFDLATLGPRPGNRFNVPNPDLEAESVWSYDIGLKSRGDRWQAEVFLFYSDYRDKISSELTGDITESGRLVVRSANLNEARLYGLESGIRGYLDEALEVYGVLNLMRGEETGDDGTTVPGDRIPPLNGKLGLVWQPRANLRIEPFVAFAGEQDRLSPRDETDPRMDPAGTSGWGTLNLLASWQTTEQIELGLRLENLGDKNYREHGSGIDAPGMNAGLWLDYRFD